MREKRSQQSCWLLAALLVSGVTVLSAQPGQMTRAQMEDFLLNAKVVKTKGAPGGITGSIQATLSDGKLTHDAHIQTIDEYKQRFEGTRGTEMNFKDTWKFNLAAYKLDQLLGLNMVPATVERKHAGKSSSFTWWVDNVLMDEADRKQKKQEPPNSDDWNNKMHIVRVFDQLIFNTDRNLHNLIIEKDWSLWMIDHTRAFRIRTDLNEPKNLEKCDKALLEKLKALNKETLKKELGTYLTGMEIDGLLKRRDTIVKIFEQKGPSALYESPRRAF